jgi:hypothetical protein
VANGAQPSPRGKKGGEEEEWRQWERREEGETGYGKKRR